MRKSRPKQAVSRSRPKLCSLREIKNFNLNNIPKDRHEVTENVFLFKTVSKPYAEIKCQKVYVGNLKKNIKYVKM